MNDPKPIPCGNWKEKLAAICPDDLPPTERDAFTIHAASCLACAAVLADDYRTDSLMRSALIGERSPELWKVFLSAVSKLNAANEVLPDELLKGKFLRPSSNPDERDEIIENS